jgi:hypothetical protein
MVLSLMAQRRVIGLLGACLPLIVMIGGWNSCGHTVLGSVSAYYHSNMRDFFVGMLAMTGVFLLAYRGHDAGDRFFTFLAGVFALAVAFLPTVADGQDVACKEHLVLGPLGIFQLPGCVSRLVHYVCAVALFISLTVMCFRFMKSGGTKTDPKKQRNKVYLGCATFMALALVGGGAWLQFDDTPPRDLVLIIEAICLGAFGVAWLVKGETILSDAGTLRQRIGHALRNSRFAQVLPGQGSSGAARLGPPSS